MTTKEVFNLAHNLPTDLCQSLDSINEIGLLLTESESDLLKLTLIQKWLRDEFEYNVVVQPTEVNVSACYYEWKIITTAFEQVITKEIIYPTYEDALLNGINEALKLI